MDMNIYLNAERDHVQAIDDMLRIIKLRQKEMRQKTLETQQCIDQIERELTAMRAKGL